MLFRSETLAEEPMSMSLLVRELLTRIAFEGMGAALPAGSLNLEQARSFVRKTEDMYHREGLEHALAYEAPLWLHFVTRNPAALLAREGSMPVLPATNAVTLLVLYPSPLGDNIVNADRETCARFMERIILAAQEPYYEAQSELGSIEAELAGLSSLKGYTKALVPELMKGQRRVQARNEALLDLMRLGLLLEAHHADTGSYPANLTKLADEFGDDLPVDPFTGESYVYVPKDDTFLLYSVGMNQVDDGGKHAYVEGDIVWRGVEEPETPPQRRHERRRRQRPARIR